MKNFISDPLEKAEGNRYYLNKLPHKVFVKSKQPTFIHCPTFKTVSLSTSVVNSV